MTDAVPADWHPDPFRRFELRYWNGQEWSEHVATQGVQGVDPPVWGTTPVAAPVAPVAPVAPIVSAPVAKGRVNKKAMRDVQRAGASVGAQAGGGTLLTEPILVVNQKAKFIEVNAEYVVFDQFGRRVGAVRQVGNNFAKKMAGVDQMGAKRLQIIDADGTLLMTLNRPVAILKSTVTVRDPQGGEIGQIVQKNLGLLGRVDFLLQTGGETIGTLNGEDWHAWNFNIQDDSRNEVARIGKAWAGSATESWFSKKDNYVVTINRPVAGPMRMLTVAAALVIDTVLRQSGQPER